MDRHTWGCQADERPGNSHFTDRSRYWWCSPPSSLLLTLQSIPAQMPADSTNISFPKDFCFVLFFAPETTLLPTWQVKLQGFRI